MPKPLISHIGIAVVDLESALEKYGLLTDSEPEICEVPDQKVKVAIFSSELSGLSGLSSLSGDESNGGRIELVSPTSDDSPVAKFIEKKGEGLHHICVYVNDINAKLSELKESGVRLIDETPRRGAEGNLIAFVHPKDMNGVLIELEEKVID